jgi:hypothetical protein
VHCLPRQRVYAEVMSRLDLPSNGVRPLPWPLTFEVRCQFKPLHGPSNKRSNSDRGNTDPGETASDVLPAQWQDLAERRSIPEDQIFRSWRRFKEVSSFPYQLSNWQAWLARERVGGRTEAFA